MKITPDLNELKMMSARIGKMGMILGNQKRFLCNYRIPAQLRVKVLESVVLTSVQLQNSGTVESQGT